jgi:acyl carrier protein
MKFLRQRIAVRLDVDPESVDMRAQLTTLGMSSLRAVELKAELEAELGLSLRSSLMFDYPTLELLVPYLLKRIVVDEPSSVLSVKEASASTAAITAASGSALDATAALAAELEALRREG